MTQHKPPHLLLVNLGTPTAATEVAVREFLDEFLSDPAVVDYPSWFWQPFLRFIILRKRPARVSHQYASIWTAQGSPLRVATERIAADVRARAGDRLGVSTAYRYGEPSINREMSRLAVEHDGPIVVVPLFPQRTDATTGTAFKRAREAATRAGIAHRVVERLTPPDDPGYVEAMAAQWKATLSQAATPPEHLVVSYHGIPVRYNRNEGGVYTRDCEATTRSLLAAIRWPAERATLAYQSKFGPESWLTPATATVLQELPHKGIKHVAVITPGFVTEGLETIEEIGIRGRKSFMESGGAAYHRVGSVEQHPAFIDSLCALALA